MSTPHSTIVTTNLHNPLGAYPAPLILPATQTNAYRIESFANLALFVIDTDPTPGLGVITLGNATDYPDIVLYSSSASVNVPVSATAAFSVNAPTVGTVLNVTTNAAAPHEVRIANASLRLAEVTAPTPVANTAHLYAVSVSSVTQLAVVGSAVLSIGITGATGFAIGSGAHGTLGARSIYVGATTLGNFADVTAIGDTASATGATSVAVGSSATSAANGTAVGYNSTAVASGASLGSNANAAHAAVTLGRSATSTAAAQLVVGSSTTEISLAYLGQGVTSTTAPATVTYSATGGSGSNNTGSSLIVAAGRSTGTAVPTYVQIQTTTVEASGSTAQTLQGRLAAIDHGPAGGTAGNDLILLGNGAPATGLTTTPTLAATIVGTGSSSAAQAQDVSLAGGPNTSTGRGGDLTLAGGAASGSGRGGDVLLNGGISTSGTDGRVVISTNGAVRYEVLGNGNMAWFAATAVAQQARGGTLTNNVTIGGTTDQTDDWTDLTTYANDAGAIRNAVYQLSRIVRQYDIAFRSAAGYGLLT